MAKTSKVKIGDLMPDPANARRRDDKARGAIKASLERFGAGRSVVIDGEGTIRAGNGTVTEAAKLGIETVIVVEPGPGEIVAVKRSDWTEEEARAYAVADNKSTDLSRFDDGALAAILKSVPGIPPEAMGFGKRELVTFLARVGARDAKQDEVPEPPKSAITKPGDVWVLGRHRVVCGDAATVKHDREVELVFTSPPYAQQRDYTEASDVSDWDGLMRGVFGNLPVTDDAQVLVNLGLVHREGEWQPYWDGWIEWMREQGWRRFGWYVWDQGWGMPGCWNGRLAPSHEWLFHFNRRGVEPMKWLAKKSENVKARYSGQSTMRGADGVLRDFTSPGASAQPNKVPDSVVRVNRQTGGHKIDHPATFSVGLPSFILHCWAGDVYDPFLGSGTTLIAAEQLDRICYGIEIEPRYCDVTVERWENLTGGKAKRGQNSK